MAGARLARRLTLVEDFDGDGFMEKALKVAFATTDQVHVDQHFGSAVRFAVYHVTMDEARIAEAIAFEAASHDGNEDKLAARIAALGGCAAVYCQAVGASAIAQLKKVGVQAAEGGARNADQGAACPVAAGAARGAGAVDRARPFRGARSEPVRRHGSGRLERIAPGPAITGRVQCTISWRWW